MTPDKFAELSKLGFAGAALLGSVWHAASPVSAFKAALQAAEEVAVLTK